MNKRIITIFIFFLIGICVYSQVPVYPGGEIMPKESSLQNWSMWYEWCDSQSIPQVPDETVILQGCDLSIFYGDGNLNLTNPLIFVEGLDLDNSLGWRSYFYAFISKHDMAKQLLESGRDIIFINFNSTLLALESNADTVIGVIDYVNQRKQGYSENIVLGASMGGLVSRYALTKMEYDGRDHDTGLFVSLDSPQQGAYIPNSIQAWTQVHENYLGSFAPESLSTINNQLDAAACRQMLNTSVSVSGTEKIYIETDDHLTFFNNLKAIGDYPQNLKKIAIANGSGIGAPQYPDLSRNDKMFSTMIDGGFLFESVKKISFTIYDDTDLNEVPTPLFLSNRQGETQSSWFFPYVVTVAAVVLAERAGLIDIEIVDDAVSYTYWDSGLQNAPGSYRNTFQTIQDEIVGAEVDDVFRPTDTATDFRVLNHSFIPTVSALDLKEEDGSALYAFSNLESIPNIKERTPFDDIHWEQTNNDHASISAEASSFIMDYINKTKIKTTFLTIINTLLLDD